MMSAIRIGGRLGQFICGTIGLATIAGGFESQSIGLTAMMGSHATNFGMLMNYTAMIYGLYALVAVEYLKVAPRLQPKANIILDGILAVVLLIAGIVLATADYVAHCDAYLYGLHCGALTCGTVFTFFAAVAFIVTAVDSFFCPNAAPSSATDLESAPQSVPYFEESTPKKENLSPIGADGKSPNGGRI